MLWSCGNTNQSSTFSNNTIDSTNTENSKIEVDYTQLAVIQTNDEIFQFKAPKDLFVEKANEKMCSFQKNYMQPFISYSLKLDK
jgi:hypothetical protein